MYGKHKQSQATTSNRNQWQNNHNKQQTTTNNHKQQQTRRTKNILNINNTQEHLGSSSAKPLGRCWNMKQSMRESLEALGGRNATTIGSVRSHPQMGQMRRVRATLEEEEEEVPMNVAIAARILYRDILVTERR
jgi:hypothetical protein